MARSLSRETVGGSESPNSGMPLADAFRYRGAAGLEHEDLAGDVGIDVGLREKGADLAARDALDHFGEGGLHCALEGQPHLDDGPGFSRLQERLFRGGVDVFEEADHVVVADHGADSVWAAAVTLAVQLGHRVRNRRGAMVSLS